MVKVNVETQYFASLKYTDDVTCPEMRCIASFKICPVR